MDRATLPHAQSTTTLYTKLTKDSNSKTDLQTHLRSLAIVPFDDFLIVFIVTISPSRDIIICFPKFKDTM